MKFEAYTFPQRRSSLFASHGMVATSQPLAAQAGLDILKAGGNAVDAAIATVATLCVVEPTSTGIGGDAFALIWQEKEKKLYGLNASGPAPQNLTAVALRRQGHRTMPTIGGHSVTVPGSLRGWQMALERFGTRGLDTLLRQPIAYAQEGFPVSQRIAWGWYLSTEKMSRQADSRRVWLPNGRSPQAGERFRNPEFAQTLQTIATQGIEAFYHGDIAAQIVACVQADDGLLALADLANYQAQWIDPIQTTYHGYTFHEIPPNGQGLTALLTLNILERFDLPAYGTAAYYHLLIEATKLAFADAHTYIADPKQADIPLDGLLSKAYAAERAQHIRVGQASMPQHGHPPRHGDTVYLTVADKDGNMVSWIQSLYMGFGSGLTAGTTGIQLQNRGANFSLEAGHANEVGPGKRPYHTIIPGFITKAGEAFSSFGVMGGFMQPQGHVQVGLNLVQWEMDPQTALHAPRFNWLEGMEVALETAVASDICQTLSDWGHGVVPREKSSFYHYGGGQVILRDPATGTLIGGTEPRNDGTAVGW